MQAKRNVTNLTAWVNPEEKKLWEEDKLKTGLGWSEWIKQKVKMSMNINQLPVYNGEDVYQLKENLRKKQLTIESLYNELHQLESKDVAVLPEERIIKVLRPNLSYTDFNKINNEYISYLMDESDVHNIIHILEKMTIDGKIECNRTGSGWRLKGKQWDKLRKERQKK